MISILFIFYEYNFLNHQNFFYKYIDIFWKACLLNLALVNYYKKRWAIQIYLENLVKAKNVQEHVKNHPFWGPSG